jgi:Fe-S cluster assembly protein SufD
MVETSENIFTKDFVENLSRRNNEPQWMLSKRLRSWMIYNESVETKKERISFSDVDVEEFLSSEKKNLPKEDFHIANENRSGSLVFENSATKEILLHNELREKGVIVSDLKTALQQHSSLFEKYFMNDCVQITDGKFVSLHSAFVDNGVFVYVPKNVNVTLPVHSHYILSQINGAHFPHLVIVCEPQSSLTFLDSYNSPDVANANESLVSAATELFIGEGARLNYVCLQEFGENVLYRNFKRAMLKKDATLSWIEISLGGKKSHNDVEIYIEESGVNAEIIGIYFAENEQKMSFNTLQKHIAPHCHSNLLFKGVLADKAQTSYEGMIRVHKGAQKTDAYQKNQNILLSNGSRADSLPELEIEADDVRCTHGATVGPIKENDLFYLMSRGLSRKEATRLLTLGFFSEAIDQISVEDVRNEVMSFIGKRLEHVE